MKLTKSTSTANVADHVISPPAPINWKYLSCFILLTVAVNLQASLQPSSTTVLYALIVQTLLLSGSNRWCWGLGSLSGPCLFRLSQKRMYMDKISVTIPLSVLQVWFFIGFWSVFCVKEKKMFTYGGLQHRVVKRVCTQCRNRKKDSGTQKCNCYDCDATDSQCPIVRKTCV